MRRMVPSPPFRIVPAADAVGVGSFADWYEACMYDPAWGYYASGRVEFGPGGDFSTYPQRLSPVFGWMLWDVLEHLLEPIARNVSPETPLTLLEFGAGDGDLADDILTRMNVVGAALAPRLRYRIVERSPELRERQRARLQHQLDAGRVEIVDGSITDYRHEGPFSGVAFANEVLDALPCEQLHITGDAIYRTHVVMDRSVDPPAFVEELHVLLDDGWAEAQGVMPVPVRLRRHLQHIAPLIEDLREAGLTPADYYWSERAADAIETFARLGNSGTMNGLLIDYGGTSRHVLNRTLRPHLRVYARDDDTPRKHNPYARPGQVDITWDQDFTALGRLAAAAGMAVHFGHQRLIEPPSMPLSEGPFRDELVRRQAELGHSKPEVVAADLVNRFRTARGFRTLLLTPPDLPPDVARFGPSDPFDGPGLETIAATATRARLHAALASVGHPELAMMLGRGCDIIGTLSDFGLYEERAKILHALRADGLLS